MIDLHSHILVGLDDGARTVEDALALAQNCIETGVTHVMCTPHIHPGVFDNNVHTIQAAFDITLNAFQQANLPLKLAMGSEVRISTEMLAWIKQDELPFIGTWQGKSALLLELPHSHIPPGVENVIKWLLSRGIQPIIPHPERNRDILNNYSKARWLKQLGCVFQATAGAYIGRFKKNVEETVWTMHDEGLINYIASDMHSVKGRPNDMLAAYKLISDKMGQQEAELVCKEVPQSITAEIVWQ